MCVQFDLDMNQSRETNHRKKVLETGFSCDFAMKLFRKIANYFEHD